MFTGRPSRINLRKYCSYECSVEAKKNRIYKTCPVCGNEFHTTPSVINIGKGKYCSHACWAKNRTMNGVVEVNCKHCNKPFNQFKYALDKGIGKYCSKYCRDHGQSGPNATNWKGGASFKRYCPKFNEEFKERVRVFFDRTCVLCSKPEHDNKKRLSVHHVTGNKRMCCDGETPAFVSLCESCHHRVHNNMEQYQIYFLELIEQNHGGKCYYTKNEYRQVIQTGSLNAQSPISSFQ